ncbi:MBL fold metallo-hydrolase [Mycobacteroides chelonae]|uniref:MBL fold metallo-hydrolase n=1 Tax=Mycobacteroides chelonae TaxID=1774 RepID=A0AB73U3A9_MYCCH|nr:MBL fold metallo-hydrolase [Mycobacteroides chelonae]MBF9315258.1 MBL fold metallo-hydrolase [Mycobacteroides chelonae]MEC4840456.1 MBL fold metallo-hydrolase [Mycobacteroides chelonae]MEC4843409.1 MBL fold metallo-hydrolase [Mycobacteroides chelonae]OHT73841.1 hypothetical protein BKG66_06275 [Mycobacteroides chelonae]OHT76397.1 hypothetical protein BKG67_03110 [Mycobacteroides chelonae]
MKVHHLNCGTMDPLLSERHICHVLLLETNNGLVLVDSGFGRSDIAHPRRRIGAIRHLIRPRLLEAETAAAQVAALGFDVADVRHIVATHLDIDHIGGVSDFPHAQLHTTASEATSAYSSRLRSRLRYRDSQLPSDRAAVVEHHPGTAAWQGFTNVTPLPQIDDGIAFIPMPGHTMGHACVAVDAGHRWILHCGDAFYHHQTLRDRSKVPATSKLFERLSAESYAHVRRNHDVIKALSEKNEPDLVIVCAHDRELLERAQQSAGASVSLPRTQHRDGWKA